MVTAATPELLAAAEADYAKGDFAAVRAKCAELSHDADADAELAPRARALAAGTEPDLAAYVALGVSLALFLGVVVAYAT
jgi:hypothetical protein